MRSIKIKIFSAISLCSIFIAVLIGFVSISHATSVAVTDSKEKLTFTCENKAGELNSTITKVEESVNTLSEIALDNLDDVKKFSSDSEYVKNYLCQHRGFFILNQMKIVSLKNLLQQILANMILVIPNM